MIFFQIRDALQSRLKDILLTIALTYPVLFFTVPNIATDYKGSSTVIASYRVSKASMASANPRQTATGYLLAYTVAQVDLIKSPTVAFQTEVLDESAASSLKYPTAANGTLFILSADPISINPQDLSGRHSFLDLFSCCKQRFYLWLLDSPAFSFFKDFLLIAQAARSAI
jgi:hypothetical protein